MAEPAQPQQEQQEEQQEEEKNEYKWQWEDDGSEWKDYGIVINNNIEKSFQSKHNSYQFVVGDNKIYEIKFNTLKQCNIDTGFERNIQRIIFDNKNKSKKQYKWEWESDTGWPLIDVSV
eukprot:104311_1